MNPASKDKSPATHILDNAKWNSLSGPHAHLAEVCGLARRYPVDISPFNAIADILSQQAWDDLHTLIGDNGVSIVIGGDLKVFAGWRVIKQFPGVQLTGEHVRGEHDHELIKLTDTDVPEMLDLIARTEPGPFLPRTIELGGYLGIRVNEELVAMAGRRINPPGWIEVSAVCTAAEYRGRGYAARLVKAVVAGIRESGEEPFLHASAENKDAIRLYEKLGFKIRSKPTFTILRPIAKVISEGD